MAFVQALTDAILVLVIGIAVIWLINFVSTKIATAAMWLYMFWQGRTKR